MNILDYPGFFENLVAEVGSTSYCFCYGFRYNLPDLSTEKILGKYGNSKF